jgi:cell division protein FtsI (penicillin-binding protein 3)
MKRSEEGLVSRWRMLLVMAFLALSGVGLVARAAWLQVADADWLRAQGDARNLRIEPVAATRGLILDRNGQPLAVSTPVVSVWVEPKEVLQHRDRWKALARAVGIDLEDLKDRILGGQHKEFVFVRRHLAPELADAILALDIPGVHGLTEYRRYYPAGEVTAHLVGFTDIDGKGQEGMELALEPELGAKEGQRKVVKDLRGNVVRDVAVIEDAEPGTDAWLSIDLRIQYLAHRELAAAVQQQKASGGSVVVLDVHTGEVLAMVNQPVFNPNNRQRVKTAWLRNRALTDVFEPGSTMKTFTVVAALESGQFRPGSLLETSPGYMKVGDKVIRDHHNFGLIDMSTLLAKSSNVGATQLALAMDPGEFVQAFHRFGFGRQTASGFPGESSGMLQRSARSRKIELATLSYGYGISTTMLQLAQAYATLGAGGVARPVTLRRRDTPPPGERVVDADIAAAVMKMLRAVSGDEGTATRARINGYSVAGKTGTVKKLTERGYAEKEYLSLFAGLAPATRPRLATVVMIDNPRASEFYGGLVAAPVYSAVTAGALRTLNVRPDDVPVMADAAAAPGGVL